MYPTYDGPVQARFTATEEEILRDLYSVIEAVRLKPVRLTKSGIPPKPLWNALNQRLVWKDPQSILFDWEEVDQVRFVYLLARGLDLVRPDDQGWVRVGAGADQFFHAPPRLRAWMILRSYFAIDDWDERCDARNQEGHRYNFGRAHRRDFLWDFEDLRLAVWSSLGQVGDGWTESSHLARTLTEQHPDLLLSEVCSPATLDDNGIDPEILRFINFWLALIGRFGLADLGRAEGDEATHRLFRLTTLGRRVVRGTPPSGRRRGGKPITIDQGLTYRVLSDGGLVADVYVGSRLGTKARSSGDKLLAAFSITRASIESAAREGVDLRRALAWIDNRCDGGAPAALRDLIGEVASPRSKVTIIENVVALEDGPTKKLEKQGFPAAGTLNFAAGSEAERLYAAVGGFPEEFFDYPSAEPLASWKSGGGALQLSYPVLPFMQRALLVRLGFSPEQQRVEFNHDTVAMLVADGWSAQALQDALLPLTLKKLPGKLFETFKVAADKAKRG